MDSGGGLSADAFFADEPTPTVAARWLATRAISWGIVVRIALRLVTRSWMLIPSGRFALLSRLADVWLRGVPISW